MTSVTQGRRSRRIRSTPPESVASLMAQELHAPWSSTSTTPVSTSARTRTRSPPSACTAGRMRSMMPWSLARRSDLSSSLSWDAASVTPLVCRAPPGSNRRAHRSFPDQGKRRHVRGCSPGSGQADRLGRLALHDRVLEFAHAIDRDAHDVAVRQEPGRVEPGADTRGRAGCDDGAGLERERRREVLDHLGAAEDQVGGRRVLAQLAIDPGTDPELSGVTDLVSGHQLGAAGRVAVERLAHREGRRAPLPVARADVVDHGVTRYDLEGTGGGHVL